MSMGAFKWAKSVRGLPALEKWLLVTIADFYNEEDRKAYPGKSRLSDETGISVRHITRLLNSLEERGLIRIQHWINNSTGQNLRNRYFLPVYDPQGSARDTREVVHAEPEKSHYGKVTFIDDLFEKAS